MAGVSACVQLCGQVVKAIDCQLNDHRFESKKHNFLHLALNPGPLSSKILHYQSGFGWERTRPLAVPYSTGVQVRLQVTTVEGHSL